MALEVFGSDVYVELLLYKIAPRAPLDEKVEKVVAFWFTAGSIMLE